MGVFKSSNVSRPNLIYQADSAAAKFALWQASFSSSGAASTLNLQPLTYIHIIYTCTSDAHNQVTLLYLFIIPPAAAVASGRVDWQNGLMQCVGRDANSKPPTAPRASSCSSLLLLRCCCVGGGDDSVFFHQLLHRQCICIFAAAGAVIQQ